MFNVISPLPQFFENDGSPLSAGYLYFGTANLNPETSPIALYWDAAGTQPVLQPVRTLNGYIARNGKPATVYIASDYSLTVKDKRGALVFYAPTSAFLASISAYMLNSILPLTSAAAVRSALGIGGYPQDFRLTLSSGVPVPPTDVVGATTLYACPYLGNSIALYDGTDWIAYQTAEFSVALGTLTASLPYDVFAYYAPGGPYMELVAWTNDTTRATALTYQDGVLVKSGTPTRRYLGTLYTTSTTTTEDSSRQRLLWNYYNRVSRGMFVKEATASWNYTTFTLRPADNNTDNRFNVIVGVAEETIAIQLNGAASNTSANITVAVSVGINSTSVAATNFIGGQAASPATNVIFSFTGQLVDQPAAGLNYYQWLELSVASGTTTWYGQSSSGMSGNWAT